MFHNIKLTEAGQYAVTFNRDHAMQAIAGWVRDLTVRAADAKAHLIIYSGDGDGYNANIANGLAICDRLVAEFQAMAMAPRIQEQLGAPDHVADAVFPPVIFDWFGMRARVSIADEGKGYVGTIWHALTDDRDGETEDRPYRGEWVNYVSQIGFEGHRPADAVTFVSDLIGIADRLMAERGVAGQEIVVTMTGADPRVPPGGDYVVDDDDSDENDDPGGVHNVPLERVPGWKPREGDDDAADQK